LPADWKGKVPDDADLCLVTHGHFDHSASTPAIAKASKKAVKICANYEIGNFFKKFHEIDEKIPEPMNKGGTIDYGFCKISMTTADHSSSCMCPKGDIQNAGEPTGFVIHISHLNARIYHAGDTNVFTDMGIIEELYHPNIVMIPIGDRFTMGPEGASLACSHFLKSAQHIVPMHFGTFPMLPGTYDGFKTELGKRGVDLARLVNTPEILDQDHWSVNYSALQ